MTSLESAATLAAPLPYGGFVHYIKRSAEAPGEFHRIAPANLEMPFRAYALGS
jgi:hypothetical protein